MLIGGEIHSMLFQDKNGCKQIAEFLILSRSYIVCKLYWLLSYHKG